ncbi:hypothetical protein E2C01_079219 [Portunus trituberculatus]|uniref:Uncharacterized protein n=1 Tax=Portunus trituberculatus TaxID=210409 RepID=A0A5B7IJ12_PORTR|nr:hypothetical protein [Portunus trituberculatus]
MLAVVVVMMMMVMVMVMVVVKGARSLLNLWESFVGSCQVCSSNRGCLRRNMIITDLVMVKEVVMLVPDW